jgi:hypothetical protein
VQSLAVLVTRSVVSRFRCPLRSLSPLALGAAIACGGDSLIAPSVGTLEITTSTTGTELDADGYTLTIDGQGETAIGANGTVQRGDLEPGNHTVLLSGIAANCTVAGENPSTANIVAGQLVTVAFSVTCTATTGSLRVTSSTSGLAPDADGYIISIDGTERGTLGPSGDVTLAGLTAGDHLVGLSGVAGNCQVQGENPRTVSITGGATVPAAFAVVCSAPPANAGTLRISTTTTGLSPDADGYAFAVDGGTGQTIGVNSVVTLPNVAAGAHTVRLSGVAGNCSVDGTNPRSVSVPAGATASVTFTVGCSSVGVTDWTPIPLPAGFNSGLDVWGSSATDLFVTGYDEAGGPAIWHYDGQSWSKQFQRTGISLSGIWGSSASDVFAAATNLESRTGVILHYDGVQWSEMPGQMFSGEGAMGSVWGTSSGDVFAGGRQALTNTYRVLLGHYDGTSWSKMPADVGGDFAAITGLSGSSPTDVYAIGDNQICDECNRPRNFVAHYDGAQWTESFETIDNGLFGIWVGASNDVWVVGEGFDHEGYLLHYDGTRWTQTFRRTPEGNVEPPLSDVWGSSGSDIYAVGEGGILRYDGTSWTPINPTPGTRVWGTSTGDVFVLGGDAVLHGTH